MYTDGWTDARLIAISPEPFGQAIKRKKNTFERHLLVGQWPDLKKKEITECLLADTKIAKSVPLH